MDMKREKKPMNRSSFVDPLTKATTGTLVDLLCSRGMHLGEKTAYTFLADGEVEQSSLTYGALDRSARSIAARLQAMGLEGERAILAHPQGLEYLCAFFGCLYAGVIAVPAYPPRFNRLMGRLRSIATDAKPAVILATEAFFRESREKLEEVSELAAVSGVATDSIGEDDAGGWHRPAISEDSLAFLQYTSGSTSAPKGVMLTHRNLISNLAYSANVAGRSAPYLPESIVLSWLPLFHDMGLINGALLPFYAGCRTYLFSPSAFLQQPVRWLQAVSRFRVTHSHAPDFAYRMCLKRCTEAQRAALDLSGWRMAGVAAEPIRPNTLTSFADAFAPCGFRFSAFHTAYGLAEATLLVTGMDVTDGSSFCRVSEEALS
jgi:acyl-CoA synthetase (AMP-forming)/AMP-acid ligase II